MRPLENVKIVELATHVAVPNAARLFADWGADVIKVEFGEGDQMRIYAKNVYLPCTDDCNPIFTSVNNGKKFVSIDLANPKGRELFLRLLEDADVFMTNVRLKGLKKLGIDHDTLKETFPKLIYFHFDGFGKNGPDKDRPGFDAAAFWASAGMTGDWPTLGESPLRPGPGFGDVVTSFNVAATILAALYHRTVTGEALYGTTSLLATGMWCNFISLMASQDCYKTVSYPRAADADPNPIMNSFFCKDGKGILIYGGYHKAFKELAVILDIPEFLTDPKFAEIEGFYKYKSEIYYKVKERMASQTSDYWLEKLGKSQVVHAKLLTGNEVNHYEQAWANDYITEVEFPNGTKCNEIQTPSTFEGLDRMPIKQVGAVGCDTKEVFKRLGYTDSELDEMKALGAINW